MYDIVKAKGISEENIQYILHENNNWLISRHLFGQLDPKFLRPYLNYKRKIIVRQTFIYS